MLASFMIEPRYTNANNNESYINHEDIYWIEKIRDFERRQLPFLKTVVDFDIVIEIGYAEEQGQSLTLKQLFLLNLSSRTTVRRKLATCRSGSTVRCRARGKNPGHRS